MTEPTPPGAADESADATPEEPAAAPESGAEVTEGPASGGEAGAASPPAGESLPSELPAGESAPAPDTPAAATPAKKAAATRAAAAKRARIAGAGRSGGPGRNAGAARTGAARASGRARSGTSGSPAATASSAAGPAHPATLAIDIGGTGLKASVLDAEGRLLADRVRVPTTYPVTPEQMVDELVKLVKPLPAADRASAGFPGVVRRGHVLTAPHFVTKSGPGSRVVKELVTKWTGFDLAGALAARLGVPVRVANDADLQGWAVISGHGIEMVVTLGTGVGTAIFAEGKLAPHIELAHHPFRKGETYNEQIGEEAMKRIGVQKWRKRVLEAIGNFDLLVNYDHLYLGGGNARHLRGHLAPSVTIVDNVAGIVGGIKLWVHGGH